MDGNWRRRWLMWGLLGVVLAVPSSSLAVVMATHTLSENDQLASIVSVYLGILSVLLAAIPFVRGVLRSRGNGRAAAVKIADKLTEKVWEQWDKEIGILDIRHPARLVRLSWGPADRDLTDHPEVVFPSTVGSGRFRVFGVPAQHMAGADSRQQAERMLSGCLDHVTETFLTLPTRRLVVLGAAGAGKSVLAIRLTVDLLQRRAEIGDRVPVLLSACSWNPTIEKFTVWLTRRLAEEYFGGRSRLVRRLIDDKKILPILDGLDEIGTQHRGAALRRLDEEWPTDPLVVTCRHHQYADMVADTQRVLTAAAVVELAQVSTTDARQYLDALRAPADRRWNRLLAELRDHPLGSPLTALRTPLMLWLTHMIYSDPATDPAELLDLPDPGAVEEHLLDQFVVARFGHLAPSRKQRRLAHLAYLAGHLRRQGSTDLAWWRLGGTPSNTVQPIGRLQDAIAAGFANAAALGLLTILVTRLIAPHAIPIALGLLLGCAAWLATAVGRAFGHAEMNRPSIVVLTGLGAATAVTGLCTIAVQIMVAADSRIPAGFALPARIASWWINLRFDVTHGFLQSALKAGVVYGVAAAFVVALASSVAARPPSRIRINFLPRDRSTVIWALLLTGLLWLALGDFLSAAAVLLAGMSLTGSTGHRGAAALTGLIIGLLATAAIVGRESESNLALAFVQGAIGGYACVGALVLLTKVLHGLNSRFIESAVPTEAATPDRSLRQDLTATTVRALIAGVTMGLVVTLISNQPERQSLLGPLIGLGTGLVLTFSGRIWSAVVVGVFCAIVCAALLELIDPPYRVLAPAVVTGLLVSLVVFGTSASGTFAVTWIWLACRGNLPWRLFAFLEEAHQRHVLRRIGAVYQFRHPLLCDRLVATASSGRSASRPETDRAG